MHPQPSTPPKIVTTTLALDLSLRQRIDAFRFAKGAERSELPVGMGAVIVAALTEYLDREARL